MKYVNEWNAWNNLIDKSADQSDLENEWRLHDLKQKELLKGTLLYFDR